MNITLEQLRTEEVKAGQVRGDDSGYVALISNASGREDMYKITRLASSGEVRTSATLDSEYTSQYIKASLPIVCEVEMSIKIPPKQ